MNDSNQFPSQGFASYDQPRSSRKKGIIAKILGPSVAGKLRNPLVATAAFLFVAVAFAGIILISYPDQNEDGALPVIKAEQTAFKEAPENSGGMVVPFQDSTIFSSMRDGDLQETPPIENLLAQEQPVDRFAFGKSEDRLEIASSSPDIEPASGNDLVEGEITTINLNETEPSPIKEDDGSSFELTKIEQSNEKVPAQDMMKSPTAPDLSSANNDTAKPKEIYAAGSSPDTLDFVRSVLDKKDAETTAGVSAKNTTAPKPEKVASVDTSANTASAIEPASGASVAAFAIKPGNHFVQLASITSEAAAGAEWGKMEKSYKGLLNNVSYRVERADLAKGTFYRIQAGPMSKDSASQLCDRIKAQKPGGCLVTK